MAHILQERYSNLVLAKLRQTLITKDNVIFNTSYEGNPKAGTVKIPVRGEVSVLDYDKAKGVTGVTGSTTYMDLAINKDKAINEIIDGYDASAVPDGIVADRLDSAGYSLALDMDQKSIGILETQGTVLPDTKSLTKSTAYEYIIDVSAKMTRAGVPTTGRYIICSPEFKALLLKDSNFIKSGDLAQTIVETGAFGQINGFNCYESGNTAVGSKTGEKTTEFIAGHPLYASRVVDFSVPVHIQDLNGSGNYIGASAVQGREVWGAKVTVPAGIYVKQFAVS